MNSARYREWFLISFIVTVLAGFAVSDLNIIKVKGRMRHLQTALDSQTEARKRAETKLAGTLRELETTVATLQASTVAKESALVSAVSEKRRAEQLDKELTIARREGGDARAELSRYRTAGMEPEQIVHAAAFVKNLQNEVSAAQAENKTLHNQAQSLGRQLQGEDPIVRLPADLNGKVLASDSRWHFVVVDTGEKQGVLMWSELLVSRAGRLVAKVIVTRVEPDRCIATVVPGWGLGEIAEGDRVIAANPGS